MEDRTKKRGHVDHCFPSLARLIDARTDIVGLKEAPTSGALKDAKQTERPDLFDQEYGRTQPMNLVLDKDGAPDPIFKDLGDKPKFALVHHDWVHTLPPGFEELARSDLKLDDGREVGRNQCIKHSSKLIYTSQFHPEQDYNFPNDGCKGSRYLRNFFAMVEKHWADRRDL